MVTQSFSRGTDEKVKNTQNTNNGILLLSGISFVPQKSTTMSTTQKENNEKKTEEGKNQQTTILPGISFFRSREKTEQNKDKTPVREQSDTSVTPSSITPRVTAKNITTVTTQGKTVEISYAVPITHEERTPLLRVSESYLNKAPGNARIGTDVYAYEGITRTNIHYDAWGNQTPNDRYPSFANELAYLTKIAVDGVNIPRGKYRLLITQNPRIDEQGVTQLNEIFRKGTLVLIDSENKAYRIDLKQVENQQALDEAIERLKSAYQSVRFTESSRTELTTSNRSTKIDYFSNRRTVYDLAFSSGSPEEQLMYQLWSSLADVLSQKSGLERSLVVQLLPKISKENRENSIEDLREMFNLEEGNQNFGKLNSGKLIDSLNKRAEEERSEVNIRRIKQIINYLNNEDNLRELEKTLDDKTKKVVSGYVSTRFDPRYAEGTTHSSTFIESRYPFASRNVARYGRNRVTSYEIDTGEMYEEDKKTGRPVGGAFKGERQTDKTDITIENINKNPDKEIGVVIEHERSNRTFRPPYVSVSFLPLPLMRNFGSAFSPEATSEIQDPIKARRPSFAEERSFSAREMIKVEEEVIETLGSELERGLKEVLRGEETKLNLLRNVLNSEQKIVELFNLESPDASKIGQLNKEKFISTLQQVGILINEAEQIYDGVATYVLKSPAVTQSIVRYQETDMQKRAHTKGLKLGFTGFNAYLYSPGANRSTDDKRKLAWDIYYEQHVPRGLRQFASRKDLSDNQQHNITLKLSERLEAGAGYERRVGEYQQGIGYLANPIERFSNKKGIYPFMVGAYILKPEKEQYKNAQVLLGGLRINVGKENKWSLTGAAVVGVGAKGDYLAHYGTDESKQIVKQFGFYKLGSVSGRYAKLSDLEEGDPYGVGIKGWELDYFKRSLHDKNDKLVSETENASAFYVKGKVYALGEYEKERSERSQTARKTLELGYISRGPEKEKATPLNRAKQEEMVLFELNRELRNILRDSGNGFDDSKLRGIGLNELRKLFVYTRETDTFTIDKAEAATKYGITDQKVIERINEYAKAIKISDVKEISRIRADAIGKASYEQISIDNSSSSTSYSATLSYGIWELKTLEYPGGNATVSTRPLQYTLSLINTEGSSSYYAEISHRIGSGWTARRSGSPAYTEKKIGGTITGGQRSLGGESGTVYYEYKEIVPNDNKQASLRIAGGTLHGDPYFGALYDTAYYTRTGDIGWTLGVEQRRRRNIITVGITMEKSF